jgi:hypothetical protein
MDQPPLYIDKGSEKPGRVAQRCSREYKRAVLRRAHRRWLRSMGFRHPKVTVWIGFAADEADRVQKAIATPDVQWETLEFPAFRMGVTRESQRADLIRWTGRAPMFSCCVFCPYKTPARWAATTGADADLAVRVDEAVRNLDELGLTDGPAYLSNRLVPVASLVRRPEIAVRPDEPEPRDCSGGSCFL